MGPVIARPPLPPGPYLLVGLARSGVAAGLALRERGADVSGVDSGRVPGAALERLRAAGVDVHAQHDGVELLARAGSVIKSPGVPKEAPVIAAARERGIPVVGEFETGWRLLRGHEFVAVTGSNGMTTTVELIGHLHE
jgi:UDP-N-acetylmuramoylalanine--D-glutamate ligase